MDYELVVAEPVYLDGRSYNVGEVVDEAHTAAAAMLHPNHFRRRAKTAEEGQG